MTGLIVLLSVSIQTYNERLAIILGLLTLLFALAVLVSCRSFVSFLQKIGEKNSLRNPLYSAFFKYHSYYWWLFWIVFFTHLTAAVMHLGFRNSSDPDAYLHIYSVGFGLGALLCVGLIGFSCRGMNSLVRLFSEQKLSSYRILNFVYGYHQYVWWGFLILIAAHFYVGYRHSAGFWPSGI